MINFVLQAQEVVMIPQILKALLAFPLSTVRQILQLLSPGLHK